MRWKGVYANWNSNLYTYSDPVDCIITLIGYTYHTIQYNLQQFKLFIQKLPSAH